jgi:hypothetical protein
MSQRYLLQSERFIAVVDRRLQIAGIGNPDAAEIEAGAAKDAGFSPIWSGADFQAFRKAHLDGRIPNYCRGCYRSPDKRQQAVDTSIADAPAA